MRKYLPTVCIGIFIIVCCQQDPSGLIDNPPTLLLTDTTIAAYDTLVVRSLQARALSQDSAQYLKYSWVCDSPHCLAGKTDSSEVKFSTNFPGRYTVNLTLHERDKIVAFGKAIILVTPAPPTAAIRLFDTLRTDSGHTYIQITYCHHDTIIMYRTFSDSLRDTVVKNAPETPLVIKPYTIGDTLRLDGRFRPEDTAFHLVYRWSGSDPSLKIGTALIGMTSVWTRKLGTYKVTLTVSDTIHRRGDSTSIYLRFDPPPLRLAIAPDDTLIRTGDTLTLTCATVDTGSAPPESLHIIWSTNGAGQLRPMEGSAVLFTAAAPSLCRVCVYGILYGDTLDSACARIEVKESIVDTQKVPIAKAGRDDTIRLGDSVQLDGSESRDPNGDNLSYYWSLPDGGTLSSATAIKPWFSAQKPGAYLVTLRVFEGKDSSQLDWVKITVRDTITQPVIRAIADYDSVIFFGNTASLNGQKSRDSSSVPLLYRWQALSGGFIIHPDSVRAQFTASEAGTFAISLLVRDSLDTTYFDRALFNIRVIKEVPIANAGQDTSVKVDSIARLNATQSTGRPLQWSWNSLFNDGKLSDSSDSMPTFWASNVGTYPISLFVFNGKYYSDTDWVFVSVTDTTVKLRAFAGPGRMTYTNVAVRLDGTASRDSNDVQVEYKWTSINGGTIDKSDTSCPLFIADKPNTYLISLIVFNGKDTSAAAFTTVEVKDSITIPTARIEPVVKTIQEKEEVIIDGSKSSSPNGDSLKFIWKSLDGGNLVVGSDSSYSVFSSPTKGSYTIMLTVSNGKSESTPVFAKIIVIANQISLIADAGKDDSTMVGASVQLDGSGSAGPNSTLLTYLWNLTNGGNLSDFSIKNPWFSAQLPGSYIIMLRVIAGKDTSAADWVNILVKDTLSPPIIYAIPEYDSVIMVDSVATLNGERSRDSSHVSLIYRWQTFSGGVILHPDSARAQFTASEVGTFVISLLARDSLDTTRFDRALFNIRVIKEVPIANAGQDTSVKVDSIARLNGTQSTGRPLHWSWHSLIPDGKLSNSLDSAPAFTAAKGGTYPISLVVFNGKYYSDTDWVFVTVRDTTLKLRAFVNPEDSTVINRSIRLSGSASQDSNSFPVHYKWRCINGGVVENSDTSKPLFSAEKPSVYFVSLVVYNGKDTSAPAYTSVKVKDTNVQPIAEAGKDTTMRLGDSVRLDGSGSSDPNGDHVIFKWSPSSGGRLSSDTIAKPWFFANKPGAYVVTLRVFDGKDTSAIDWVNITVWDTSGNKPPVADAGDSLTLIFPANVMLSGVRSSDPDNGPSPLKYTWASNPRNPTPISSIPSNPTPMLGVLSPGIYYFTLYVFDGQSYSKPSQVRISIIGPDIFVHPDSLYKTLSQGLVAAKPGDKVYVAPGLYREDNDCILKSGILLFGVNKDSTIIDLGCYRGAGKVLLLDSVSNVTVQGLTLRHGGRSDTANHDVFVGNIVCRNTNGITLQDDILDSACGDGLRLVTSKAVTLQNIKIHGNGCNGIRSGATSFTLDNCTVSNNGGGIDPFNGVSIEGFESNDGSSAIAFIRSTNFQDNKFQHISIYSPANVIISENNFQGYGGGILTAHETVNFSNNAFGPYTTPDSTGYVYLTVYKKIANTINNRIQWGWGDSAIYTGTTPLDGAKGVVIRFRHRDFGNDIPITVESDGEIKHVFQPLRGLTYPEWSDLTYFKHEEW